MSDNASTERLLTNRLSRHSSIFDEDPKSSSSIVIDKQFRLSLSKNGRKLSISSVRSKSSIISKRKKSKKKKKVKKSKSKIKRDRRTIMKRKELESPQMLLPLHPTDKSGKKPSVDIQRRITRNQFLAEQELEKSEKNLNLAEIFKNSIELSYKAQEKDVDKVDQYKNGSVRTTGRKQLRIPQLTNENEEKEIINNFEWTVAKDISNFISLILSKNSPNIQAISLGLNEIKIINYISKILLKTDFIKKLSLAGNKLGGEIGFENISNYFENSKNLNYLHLWGCALTDNSCEIFCDILKDNEVLKFLILSKNKITQIGAEYLCDGLTYNEKLEFLDLGENFILDEGAEFFSDLLQNKNQTLKHLDLSDNGITMKGAKSLASSLRYNVGIEELTLAFNEVTENNDMKLQSIGWMIFKQ